MSVAIDVTLCVGCGECAKVCPGSLLEVGPDGKAAILYPSDCWGCVACVKACPEGAAAASLPISLGGRGGRLTVGNEKGVLVWIVSWPDGRRMKIA
ncbi:MAG: ferredoxin family protein, partial [Deltaproteobacteria bacterium]|nr:ferredoxin family protein [Deltaproteobacteria bacterium]